MHTYNEPQLLTALSAMALRERTAFAVACALRLRSYFGYPDSPAIPPILEVAMAALVGTVEGTVSQHAVLEAVAECEEQLDIDDDFLAAVIYASRVAGPEGAQAAAWAARRAYEARDRHVADVRQIDFNADGAEEEVLAQPIVQAEVGQQVADLANLATKASSALDVVRQAQVTVPLRPTVRAPAV